MNNIYSCAKNQKGAVMVIAVFIIVLLVVFVMGILDIVVLEAKSSLNSEKQQQTYYKAYSTMASMAWRLKNDLINKDTSCPQDIDVNLGEMGISYVKLIQITTTGNGNGARLRSAKFLIYPTGDPDVNPNVKPIYQLEMSDSSSNDKKPKISVSDFQRID